MPVSIFCFKSSSSVCLCSCPVQRSPLLENQRTARLLQEQTQQMEAARYRLTNLIV